MRTRWSLWLVGGGFFLLTACLLVYLLATGPIPSLEGASAIPSAQTLSGTSLPLPTQSTTSIPLAIPTEGLALAVTAIPSQPPAILESRLLTLEYPEQIRSGDSDVVRLTLETDASGNITPTAEVKGNHVTGQPLQIPNLYDTHDVIAEARLDLAGPEIRPSGAIDEPLLPGQAVTFYWSVRPTDTGTFRGTVWLFLKFVNKTTREESQKAISAQMLQIESTNFFGLSGSAARTTGGIGAIVGAVLGFPFASDIMKWVFTRIMKKST